jgi:hypothetical protein
LRFAIVRSIVFLGRIIRIVREEDVIDARVEGRACRPAGDVYPSPSGGCISGPCSWQNFSDSAVVISLLPERLRISSIEVALEGQSGA